MKEESGEINLPISSLKIMKVLEICSFHIETKSCKISKLLPLILLTLDLLIHMEIL